ncbi:hypothetical protein HJC23_007579 [Cyclotella cryptica]|uniref:Uncharacterized protein n=1 Tax=Cyclotella cryptica TaxID=29204 RepID=A0ABD3QRE7_9STRA
MAGLGLEFDDANVNYLEEKFKEENTGNEDKNRLRFHDRDVNVNEIEDEVTELEDRLKEYKEKVA